ncbi:hypothetical protein COO91_07082 [Nostoc flagelliforme CCNUN1]|uniref:Uncharacterized protein n=2 Tax=Nostoc flagelliforme TaxID=1306274 RepID=A0A2K8T015_9NOSO|nr:hypothetical protein COO91_07082 [Nostoc flagelliforme CCNUN1]
MNQKMDLSTALRKIVAFLMQGDALPLSVDALALSVDALALSADALALSVDALALSVDALALSNLIRYELMKCCTKYN